MPSALQRAACDSDVQSSEERDTNRGGAGFSPRLGRRSTILVGLESSFKVFHSLWRGVGAGSVLVKLPECAESPSRALLMARKLLTLTLCSGGRTIHTHNAQMN